MKIIARGNGLTYIVNHIEFGLDGTIRYIKGFGEFAGKKDYLLGAHSDHVDLDKDIELEIVIE